MRGAIAVLLIVAAACGSREKAADTSLPAPDTLKPDTSPVVSPVDTTKGAATKASGTKGTKASATTKNVAGRDSVIRMPLKTLPLPDTTKRPDTSKVAGRDAVIRMPLKTLPPADTTKRRPR